MDIKEYCNINEYRLSERSVNAVHQINNTVELGNYTATFAVALPLVQIFSNPTPHEVIKEITTYDWEEFSSGMMSVNKIVRRKVETIAEQEAFFGDGQDSTFWKCVTEAVR
ncbi:TPA: hypothetical protein ACX6R9_003050 [Photobacterium damselae]